MDRRRMTAIGVVVVAVGAATAITLPSFAGEEPAPGGAPALSAEPAPAVVDAMRRDLGLTRDEALRRLDRERWAAGVVTDLSDDLGAAYGGAWLGKDGRTLNVAVADRDQAQRVRAAGAQPKLVSRGLTQLDTLKSAMDRSGSAASDAVSGWYVDVTDNSVVVLAQPGAEDAGWRFVDRSGVPRQAVRVDATVESPRLLFDLRGGDAYLNGPGRCSVGFSVVGGFVTAGHCGRPGDRTVGTNQVAQGVFRSSSFPGDDWAFVRTSDDWVPQPVVNDFAGGLVPVVGSLEAPVGSSICRSGSTTGARCGVVQAKNTTVNYPEGTVTGLTRTNVCAEPGDSGGSWLSGNQAQGVTSGGSGDCRFGGITFFQPVNEILAANNLTLVTVGNAAAVQQPARRNLFGRVFS
ncbi:S1 family peptidase [Micromonospora sp. SH-82]|uniref:S1 family peptidase n=1 Tax=Micromonospora sp. SH-82 TaxID=3132938 RepID=UPI003EBA07AA